MKKEDFTPVEVEQAGKILASLLRNRKLLDEQIEVLAKYIVDGRKLPFDAVQDINNTGIFITNCAYHLGYRK